MKDPNELRDVDVQQPTGTLLEMVQTKVEQFKGTKASEKKQTKLKSGRSKSKKKEGKKKEIFKKDTEKYEMSQTPVDKFEKSIIKQPQDQSITEN